MSRSDLWKLVLVVVATIAAAVYLFPSYQFYTMTPAQREAQPRSAAGRPAQARHPPRARPPGRPAAGARGGQVAAERRRGQGRDRARDGDHPQPRRPVRRRRAAHPARGRGPHRRSSCPASPTARAPSSSSARRRCSSSSSCARRRRRRAVFEQARRYLVGARARRARTRCSSAHPLTGRMLDQGFVRKEEVPAVEKLLAGAPIDTILPADTQLLWSDSDVEHAGRHRPRAVRAQARARDDRRLGRQRRGAGRASSRRIPAPGA